jgi:phenylacetate-coenzyme A ligase PaaK-like adenylate-forming protein
MLSSAFFQNVFSIHSKNDFETNALEVFAYQSEKCAVYKKYLKLLGANPKNVIKTEQIPFLPIAFFKSAKVMCEEKIDIVFTSSGTTGSAESKHYVADVNNYEKSFRTCFELFYGPITDYCVIALLPSYLEKGGSSLVYMADKLIVESKNSLSGFYKDNFAELKTILDELQSTNQKTLLLGVSYALLDFAEEYSMPLKNTIVMETGGMKGKRKENTREDLHKQLKNAFAIENIHSEYGMTELLSQAYSKGNGVFSTPPWMKVLVRDVNDPLSILENNYSGGLNIIDLANIHSCSFIATQDLGKKLDDNTFEVLGRFDNSDIRGCNLLVE